MQRNARWMWMPLAVLVGCGCVPDGQYRRLLDDRDMLQKVNDGLAADNDRLKGQSDDLKLLLAKTQAEVDRERDRAVETEVAFKMLSQKTQKILEDLMAKSPGETPGVIIGADGVIQLVDTVLFDTGKAELRKGGEEILRKLAVGFREEAGKGHRIRIDGHTDDQPIVASKENYPTNWHLSGARALNVLLFLEKEGVEARHLSFSGFGEHQPRDVNAQGRKGNRKNRRVEISILN